MTARARRVAALAALTVAATVGTAHAATPHDTAPVPFDESIHMSWDGTTYAGVTAESFVGLPVVVPGDSGSRTLHVRNSGPSTGTLRASIVNVELRDPDAPDVRHGAGGAEDQGSFYDDLLLHWPGGTASFSDLDQNGETTVLEVEVPKGAEVPITIGYELPLDATSGNRANVAEREASFDVLLEMGGSFGPPTGPPSEEETPDHGLSDQELPPTALGPPASAVAVPPTGVGPPQLERTGLDAGPLSLLAALAVGVGAGLAVLARRRSEAGDAPGH